MLWLGFAVIDVSRAAWRGGLRTGAKLSPYGSNITNVTVLYLARVMKVERVARLCALLSYLFVQSVCAQRASVEDAERDDGQVSRRVN